MPYGVGLWGFPGTLPSASPAAAFSSLRAQKELILGLTSWKNLKLFLLDLTFLFLCKVFLIFILPTGPSSLLSPPDSQNTDCQGGSMVNTPRALYKPAPPPTCFSQSFSFLDPRDSDSSSLLSTPWPAAGRACGLIAPTCWCSSCPFSCCLCPFLSPPR